MAKNWKQLLGQALAGIYPALESMTDAELRNLRSAPKKMSSTNCSWVAYQGAPLIAEISDHVLRTRSLIRKKQKRVDAEKSVKTLRGAQP